MRKKFVYFVLIPAVIVLLAVYLFIDTWVRLGLEAGGEAAVGAKVELEGVHVSLSPIGLRWSRLQVADPHDGWTNLFETGPVRFAMDFGQLLRGKYVIHAMTIEGLILGTKRTTDGSLPKPPAAEAAPAPGTFTAQAQGALEKAAAKPPAGSFNVAGLHLNVDSLVGKLDIQSLKAVDSLRTRALASSAQWNASLADLETSKKKLADIEAGLTSINTAQLNSIPAITGAISTVDNAVKGIHDVSSAFDARKASIQSDVQALTASAGAIDRVAAEDFAHLQSMAKLPNLSTAGVAQLLVGEETVKKAETYLGYVDWARAHIHNSSPKPDFTTPPRMKGQNIAFPLEHAYPKLLIEKALISGGTDSAYSTGYIRAKGEIDNITNDQGVTHVPITASLEGVQGGGRTFALRAVFDRTKETPYDSYEASLGGVPLAEFPIGSADFLPARMVGARMSSSVNVVVPGNGFDAKAQTTLAGFHMSYGAEPKGVLEGIIREVLGTINEFEVTFRLWNTGGKFDMALQTDLDEKIAARASAALGAEFAKAQDLLKAKLDAVIGPKKAEVQKLVGDRTADIQKQLGAYGALINDKLGLADAKKKELTDRLTKEQKGNVGNALKNLLKK